MQWREWRAKAIDIKNWLSSAKNKASINNTITLLDLQVLLSNALQKDRSWILAHPEYQIPLEDLSVLDHFLNDLISGVPLPYIIGKWEFYGLDFYINKDVLIPRPETELLVDHAINICKTRSWQIQALDVGTGSGCISIAIASHIPNISFHSSDISRNALKIAAVNVSRNNLHERIHLIQSNLMPPTSVKYDLVCANLPYIPFDDLPDLTVSQYEPTIALNGGYEGLELIDELLPLVKRKINPNGLILLEIESNHGHQTQEIACSYFPDDQVDLINDLAGKPRLISIKI